MLVHKGLFVTGGFTGDHCAFVGFGTGGWQGQHGAHRDCAFNVAAAGFQDVPRVNAVSVVCCRRDELRAIQNGTATDRQQESNAFFTGDFYRIHQRFVRRVWLDAAELTHVQTVQGAVNLIQHAGFFHAAATVGDQHAGVSGDLRAQVGDGVFTKQNAGWGVKIKVVHCAFPLVGENLGGAEGYLMLHIVAAWGYPLNAHSCRCLAHFYRALEKARKTTHTVSVGNRTRSNVI